MSEAQREFSSFRDPSGVIFLRNGTLYRQVNGCYQRQYDALLQSGLYEELVKSGDLVRHSEVDVPPLTGQAYRVICPKRVPMISYPYEWSFGMLQDAALTTLRVHRAALAKGMILKDASAYNIQFIRGRATLIDTLSFDFYRDGQPWIAYGQFCRHFLAPLLLMANSDIRLNLLLRDWIDGIPLDLAAVLLNGKGGLFAKQHIVWHAKAVRQHDEDGKKPSQTRDLKLPLNSQIAMVDSMIRNIQGLRLPAVQTEWGDYYDHTNYTPQAAEQKQTLVQDFLKQSAAHTVWDLGANDGRFSRLALEWGASVVALDIDPLAVECGYLWVKRTHEALLPLLCDLTNPSPAIGFACAERKSLFDRQMPDCIMALAVIHHLAISNNLPLPMIAEWSASITNTLIIEFVPKTDSQVQLLLKTRDDIFPDYTEDGFEDAFRRYFSIVKKEKITDSTRILYFMKNLQSLK